MIKHLYDEIAKRWLTNCDSIYIYSDTHFSDVELYDMRGLLNIPDDIVFAKEQGDSRSYDLYVEERVEVLDEMQIKNINSKAGKNSCLIILGDVGNIECVKKLKAKYKILIMGNHDKGASNYLMRWDAKWWPDYDMEELKKDGHTEVLDYPPGAILYGKRINEGLFDEVYEGPLMINDRVILSHEPINVPNYMFNIHGHVHKADYKGDSHHLNCCAEAINYTPINLINLLQKGLLKDIDSIHRMTIDLATTKKKKRTK